MTEVVVIEQPYGQLTIESTHSNATTIVETDQEVVEVSTGQAGPQGEPGPPGPPGPAIHSPSSSYPLTFRGWYQPGVEYWNGEVVSYQDDQGIYDLYVCNTVNFYGEGPGHIGGQTLDQDVFAVLAAIHNLGRLQTLQPSSDNDAVNLEYLTTRGYLTPDEADARYELATLVTVGATAPSSPSVGDIWIDTN